MEDFGAGIVNEAIMPLAIRGCGWFWVLDDRVSVVSGAGRPDHEESGYRDVTRVNGIASLNCDPELLEPMSARGRTPTLANIVQVNKPSWTVPGPCDVKGRGSLNRSRALTHVDRYLVHFLRKNGIRQEHTCQADSAAEYIHTDQ